MDEHYPSSFFFLRVYGPRRSQYPAIFTEQNWSLKDLLYMARYQCQNYVCLNVLNLYWH